FGITIAQTVLTIPNPLITKYVGIKPPLNSIVNKIYHKIIFLPLSPFLDKAYAAGSTIPQWITVPSIVSMIVFRYPRHISLFSNTFLKPSKVMSTGHNHILPVLTAPGSLIEALTTNTSGYKITITRIATSVLLIRSKDLSERPCFFML